MKIKRSDLIEQLRSKIPSLNYEGKIEAYLEVDEDGNEIKDSVIFQKDTKEDWIITPHYMEGITTNLDGQELISVKKVNPYNKRCCYIEIMDFAAYGNTHCYGDLKIDGLEWKYIDKDCTIYSFELTDKYPKIDNSYRGKITKIFKKDNINDREYGWDTYEDGMLTQRFHSVTELIFSAMYITLTRVQGPLIFFNGLSCCLYKVSDAIMSVDENDIVTLNDSYKHLFTEVKIIDVNKELKKAIKKAEKKSNELSFALQEIEKLIVFKDFDENPIISICGGDEIICVYNGAEMQINEVMEYMKKDGFIKPQHFKK